MTAVQAQHKTCGNNLHDSALNHKHFQGCDSAHVIERHGHQAYDMQQRESQLTAFLKHVCTMVVIERHALPQFAYICEAGPDLSLCKEGLCSAIKHLSSRMQRHQATTPPDGVVHVQLKQETVQCCEASGGHFVHSDVLHDIIGEAQQIHVPDRHWLWRLNDQLLEQDWNACCDKNAHENPGGYDDDDAALGGQVLDG